MFKKRFLHYRTKRALSLNKVNRESPSFYSARKIGVIFTWEGETKAEIIRKFIHELDLSGKTIKTFCFVRDHKTPVHKDFEYFDERDFGLFGKIKSEILIHFIKAKFDYLFHLDTLRNDYIENILALSQARCRISGLDYTRQEYYDFMIKTDPRDGLEQLCKQILHYTKSLVNHG